MPASSARTNSMGLAARLVNLCSIFVSIIIGFVTLTENMTVINVVPSYGTPNGTILLREFGILVWSLIYFFQFELILIEFVILFLRLSYL